jgi:hypothetical protein
MHPLGFFKFALNKILMNRLTLFSLLIFFSCSEEDSEVTPTETIKYTVSITAGEGGTVSTSGGEYEKGTNLTISATANTGYEFEKWSDDNAENPRSLNIEENISFEAQFQIKCTNQVVTPKNLQNRSKELFDFIFPIDENNNPIWEMIHTISWYGATGVYFDYNNDGYMDIVGYENNYDNQIDMPQGYTGYERKQPIRFYLGNCDGNYLEDNLNDKNFYGLVHGRKLLLGDYNLDNYVDFFLIGHGYDKAPFPGEFPKVLMSNGQGGFTETEYTSEVSFFHGGSSGDFDNDGDLDVFIVEAGGGKSSIFENNNGILTPNRDLVDQNLMSGMYNSEFFDVNSDGFLDIIIGGHDWSHGGDYDNTPLIIYGDGIDYKNNVTHRLPESNINQQGVVTDFEFYDISDNGKFEIIVSRTGDNTIENSNFYRDWSVQILELINGNYVDATEKFIDVYKGEGGWIDWIKISNEGDKIIMQNGKYPQQDQYKKWELSNSRFIKIN